MVKNCYSIALYMTYRYPTYRLPTMAYGYLKLMVLNELEHKNQTGYQLIHSLSLELGKKPSSGSIYPLLNSMLEENLISVKEEGRKKIYSISSLGKKTMVKMFSQKEDSMLKHLRFVNKFNEFMNKGCSLTKNKVNIEFKKNTSLLTKNVKDWKGLRDLVMELIILPDYDKKKPLIKKAIKNMMKELEKIRDEPV